MISETSSVLMRRLKVVISHLRVRSSVRRSRVPPLRARAAMAWSRSCPKRPSPEWNWPSKSIQRVTCTVNAVAHSTAARVMRGLSGFSESAHRSASLAIFSFMRTTVARAIGISASASVLRSATDASITSSSASTASGVSGTARIAMMPPAMASFSCLANIFAALDTIDGSAT